jgi:hypothetical protein
MINGSFKVKHTYRFNSSSFCSSCRGSNRHKQGAKAAVAGGHKEKFGKTKVSRGKKNKAGAVVTTACKKTHTGTCCAGSYPSASSRGYAPEHDESTKPRREGFSSTESNGKKDTSARVEAGTP